MNHTIITIDIAHVGPFDPHEEHTNNLVTRDSLVGAIDAVLDQWWHAFEDWKIDVHKEVRDI